MAGVFIVSSGLDGRLDPSYPADAEDAIIRKG